tara:strand:- start:7409 stop:8671 length:1263 start_codon:yes stop_codon:yes gene_type:complete
MSRTVFIIRAYNDLDHMVPIIWKFIIKGEDPIVIFHTDLDYLNDYRIKFLKSCGKFEIHQKIDLEYIRFQKNRNNVFYKLFRRIYNYKRSPNNLIGKIYRKYFLNCSDEINYLKANNVNQCVFEWGTPYIRGEVVEKFFKASKAIGITTICIPHGCNIYSHPDVNIGYRNLAVKGKIIDARDRNEYDYYVFQNPIRRDGWVKWGYDPIKTQAWGSVRFYPEWQKINLQNCPPITIKNNPGKRLKVVFMDHQKDYNVYVDKIWHLLDRIAKNPDIFLVIKQSTRSGKDYHSKSFRNKYAKSKNVEFVGNENHSPKLIEWSDCIINFGSSIGIEVLLQDKILINPHYLHSNKTLFEKFDAALNASNEDEVISILLNILSGETPSISVESKNKIFKEIIYAGLNENDVIEKYYRNIISNKLLY